MDSPARTFAKTATWQTSGLISMTLLSWAVTGSWSAGGAIALGGMILGTVTYVLHERMWDRVSWGRQSRSRSVK